MAKHNKGDLLLNIDLIELKRLINQYYKQEGFLLKSDLLIDRDSSSSKLSVDGTAERVFLNPCRRTIPNGIVTPIVRTEYYPTNGNGVTMVQRFLNNDDIEQILRYYEAQGLRVTGRRHKRLILHRQQELEDKVWDNSKPDSHPYYEKEDL